MTKKTMTINLTDEEMAELEKITNPSPPHWRCFHCDEVFHDTHSAKLHFGMDQCSDPACKIKMGAEGSLVKALRTAENELSDAWAAIHNESTEAAKAYYAQQSRHGDQLRAAEELGYERGLTDGRAENHSPVASSVGLERDFDAAVETLELLTKADGGYLPALATLLRIKADELADKYPDDTNGGSNG